MGQEILISSTRSPKRSEAEIHAGVPEHYTAREAGQTFVQVMVSIRDWKGLWAETTRAKGYSMGRTATMGTTPIKWARKQLRSG